MSKWMQTARCIVIFRLCRRSCGRGRLDCDDFEFVRMDWFLNAAKSDRDVRPLAKGVGEIQHIAGRSCRWKKVLSRSRVADGETLAVIHFTLLEPLPLRRAAGCHQQRR